MDIEIKKAEVENINKNKSKLRRCEYHNLPLHFIDENTLKLLCIHCVKDQSRLGIISSILISEKLSRNVNTWLKLESDIVNLQSQINNQIIQVDLLLVMRKEREQEQLIEIIENEDESQNQADKENTGQILSQNIFQQKILRDRIFLKEMEKVYQPAIKLSQVNQQNEASNSVVSEQNMKLLGIIDNKGLVQEGFLIIQRDISKENLKRLKKCYKYIDEDIQKVKEQNQNQDIEGVIKLQGYYNEHLTIIEKIKDTYRKIGQEIDIIEKYLTKQTQNTGSRLDQIALCSIDDCNQWYKEQQIFKAMMKISEKQHQENLDDKTNPKELQYQLIVKLFNMQNQLLDKIREQESNIRKKQSQNIEIIQNIKEEAEHYSKLQKKEQELDKFEELQKQEELLMQQKQQYQQRQNQQNYQNPQSYQQQQSHQQNDRDYYNRQPYNQQQKFQTQNTQNYSNPEQYNNQATYSHKDAFYNNHYQQRYQHQQNPYSNRNQNNYQQQSQDLQQHQQRQQQQYQQEPNYGQQNQNNQQNKNYQRQSQNTQQNYQMKNLNNQFDRLNM